MARQEITKALRHFGERSHNIDIRKSGDRAVIYVDKEYYGVYDFERHTFID